MKGENLEIFHLSERLIRLLLILYVSIWESVCIAIIMFQNQLKTGKRLSLNVSDQACSTSIQASLCPWSAFFLSFFWMEC